MTEKKISNWSSPIAFLIASIGSAIGLGNLWKFPYITLENGGGAFVLVYLLAVLIIGMPILIAELVIGKMGKAGLYQSVKQITSKKFWLVAGLIGTSSCVIVLSYYSVVAGWPLKYFIMSLTGEMANITSANSGKIFGDFVSNPMEIISYHTVIMALTTIFIWGEIKGIERATKVLIPLLGIFIAVIIYNGVTIYGHEKTTQFLFSFDLSTLTPASILEACGHAFFTLSVGFGALVVYSAHLPDNVSLTKYGIIIAIADTFIAICACFMIFPIILGSSIDITESISVLFTSITVQLNTNSLGSYIGGVFYLLIAFAALTSTISLLEVVVAFVNETLKIERKKATLLSAFVIWVLGIFSALSLGGSEFFTKIDFFGKLDWYVSNVALPVCGILISLLAGWIIDKKMITVLHNTNQKLVKTIIFALKYVSPLLVLVVFLYNLKLF